MEALVVSEREKERLCLESEVPEFKDGNFHLLESGDYKDFPKLIVVVTRGKNGGTYMTHLMFLDFAIRLTSLMLSCFPPFVSETCPETHKKSPVNNGITFF